MTTRVLVVDDSPTMRALVKTVLETDPDIRVVGSAGDPYEARQAIKDLNPDVVTLDVEMPNMDGLEFLERLMRLRPMPVVMVSSLTTRGADATIRALEIGAVECVGKPPDPVALQEAFASLPRKVKAAAAVRPIARPPAEPARPVPPDYRPNGRVVCIGASTGGVEALVAVLAGFPKTCPPTLVVQHIPRNFSRGLARRLNEICDATVEEAVDGAPLEPGRIWLAPGETAHLQIEGTTTLSCRLVDSDPVTGHRPSADALFRSAARLGRRTLGVILTGMGRDGAAGLRDMRDAGADTIGQDEATSVVYGMPRVAFETGAVVRQLPLGAIGPAILETCRLQRRPS